ncbi:DUF6531 domain-containing protein [candidate division CSSED10-310 bacterium]|uniref:DUF6531 domain-containing protein n=1 Tax=candidate division CSSED10-310 bacterium TaxID=2855610 RepID=A0ABV6Z194_UNCC1
MFRSIIRKFLMIIVLLQSSLFPVAGQEKDWYFDQEGFKSNQNNQFGMSEETINLFNGNLILTYTDLRLPGNCGNDLVIQRFYNSKIVKWNGSFASGIASSWVGLGWKLHMGRLYNHYNPSENPVVEMPDGSRQMFFPNTISHPNQFVENGYKSKDNWIYLEPLSSTFARVLTKEGVWLDFEGEATDEEGNTFLRLSGIFNPQGCNGIWVYYDDSSQQTRRHISSIQVGGEYNDPPSAQFMVYFYTLAEDWNRLEKIVYKDTNGNDAEILYDVQDVASDQLLYSVTPPVGPPISYTYYDGTAPFFELHTITNPFGGVATYTYITHTAYIGDGSYFCNPYTRVIETRQHTGSEFPAMVWLYTYPSTSSVHHIEVTDPAGNISRHYYYGIGDETGLKRYQIGLNYKNEFYENGVATLLKVEDIEWHYYPACIEGDNCTTLHWEPEVSNCSDPSMGLCYATVPKMKSKTVTLHYTLYSKSYTIYYDSYDDYGNPTQIREALFGGTVKKKTVYTYAWQQYPYLLHEYVVSPLFRQEIYDGDTLVQTVEHEYYDDNVLLNCKFGKIKKKRIDPSGLDLTTLYDYYNDNSNREDGMLYQSTDPRLKVWEYTWDKCSLKSIQTPVGWKKFDRTINQYTGLVASQQDPNTRTTSFTYDALGRLTGINYPIENAVSISYNEVLSVFDNVSTTISGCIS